MRNVLLTQAFTAAAAIDAYRIVQPGAKAKTVTTATAATGRLIGVTTEVGPSANEHADVNVTGIAEVEYGGAVKTGDLITSDADGKAVRAPRTPQTKQAVISGRAAGNHTVSGIATNDTLISVLHLKGASGRLTGAADLTSEFSITAANTINNTTGTATTSGVLVVSYLDASKIVRTIGMAMVDGVAGDIGSVLLQPNEL